MSGSIGYYVHHHGDGHRQRALLIGRHIPDQFVMIGTGLTGRCEGVRYLDLPDDRIGHAGPFDGDDGGVTQAGALHYAPVGHNNIRRRVAMIAEWISREQPALMVVDVSVEVAMLARLAATPVIYVRLNGTRDDSGHVEAFRAARALLSPFHADLDEPATPAWVRQKTHYCAGLTDPPASCQPHSGVVLVIYGAGGVGGCGEKLAAAARANPNLTWRVIGPLSMPDHPPKNLEILGWVSDPGSQIARANVVVGAAGDGVVNSVIAAGRPFVCLPEPRPYGEQAAKAQALKRLGAAIVPASWPAPDAWRSVLADACALPARALSRLHDPHGVPAAAQFLIEASHPSWQMGGGTLKQCA